MDLAAAGNVIIGARSAAYAMPEHAAGDVVREATSYAAKRGWLGDEHAVRGAGLVAEARTGLATQPTVNRNADAVVAWLEQGGELPANADVRGSWGSAHERRTGSSGQAHWLGLNFLAPGPVDDSLVAAGRQQLGQAEFGEVSVLLDDRVLHDARILRSDWTDSASNVEGSIEDLDHVLLDRRILENSRDLERYPDRETVAKVIEEHGPVRAREEVGRMVDELSAPIGATRDFEALGVDGTRAWLSGGSVSTLEPGRPGPNLGWTRPMEAIVPSVPVEAITGIRIEPGASAATVDAVRAAAAARGIPVSVSAAA